jgi:hypothetical protein
MRGKPACVRKTAPVAQYCSAQLHKLRSIEAISGKGLDFFQYFCGVLSGNFIL